MRNNNPKKLQNFNIIKVLKTFSPTEISELKEFVNASFLKSHIYSKHKPMGRGKILKFYEILKNTYPDFDKTKLDDNIIFEKLFPGKKFNKQKLIGLRHELLRIIELYLIFADILESPVHPKLHLVNQLEKRGLEKILMQNIDDTLSLLNSEEIKNEEYFQQEYLLNHKKWISLMKYQYLGKTQKYFEYFNKELKSATNGMLLIILKLLSYSNHYKEHLNIDINYTFYENMYNYISQKKEEYLTETSLSIWFEIASLHFKEFDVFEIEALKKNIEENKKKFNIEDLEYFNLELFNFCGTRYVERNSSFKELLIRLFNERIKSNAFIENGLIQESSFTGNVSLALRLGDFKLAEEFLLKYKKYLSADIRESVYNFNNGSLLYRKKQYKQALNYLARVNKTDYFYASEVYSMQLKIYYETDAIDAAFSKMDNFKHYLKSNDVIPPDFSKQITNFLKYFEKLFKLKDSNDAEGVDYLIFQLKKSEKTSFKMWLLEKANEIKKKGAVKDRKVNNINGIQKVNSLKLR